MLEGDVRSVLSYYALDCGAVHSVEAVEHLGGWSGAQLWRVTDTAGRMRCLRRWPNDHPTVDRLQLIHAVLGLVARKLPIVACPVRSSSGATYVQHAGHLWELTEWLPGKADFREQPSRTRLAAAMQVLAKFHVLTAPFEQRRAQAPAMLDRARGLCEMLATGLIAINQSRARPLGKEIDSRASRLLELARGQLERGNLLKSAPFVPPLLLQPAIRDIHHEHVLYLGDEVSGLIDFGALRIDTPLADVARLVGSMVGDDVPARCFALDAYAGLRPLSDEDRQWIDWLDRSGVVLGALNWLVWLYVERRDMGPVGPIVRRLDELIVRLEQLNQSI